MEVSKDDDGRMRRNGESIRESLNAARCRCGHSRAAHFYRSPGVCTARDCECVDFEPANK